MLLAYGRPSPRVAVREHLCEPSLPGSAAPLDSLPPFGSHLDFIGAAYDDPGLQW